MTAPVNRRDFMAQATVPRPPRWPHRGHGCVPPGSAGRSPSQPAQERRPNKVTLGKTGIQVSLVGMGTGSHRLGPGEQPDPQGRQGVHPGRPPRARPGDPPLRRRRPVRLARLSPRGAQGRPPRSVRDPDQDPRHQGRRRPQPPRTLPAGAGGRLHRHRPAPLHAEAQLARRESRVDGLPDAGQARRRSSAPTARAATAWTR